jgi:phage terminase large subunit
MSALKAARDRIRHWRENPKAFAYDNFKIELDAWQADALAACGGTPNPRRRLCLKACTGPGKSALLAIIGWHRLACFADQGEHPKGAAISGEGRDNLRDNLWAELAKWQDRSEFLKRAFTHNQNQIYANDHTETWFLSARSYPKAANNEDIGRSLAGLHSRFPFLLLDETGAMPPTVGQKATQIFTGGVVDGLIAQAGNPTSTNGLLYAASNIERELWTVITITADPDDPKRTPRVDIVHARQMIEKYGRDNPWIMTTILGLFPAQGFNSLLSVDEVEAAMRRAVKPDTYSWSQKRLGIDVARFGDDRTVLFPRQGLMAYRPVQMRVARTTDIAARVMMARAKWKQELELIDDTGHWGHGVVDNLIAAGFSPLAIQYHAPALDPRYKNRRVEMWLEMAEWVKRGGCLPNIPELVAELTTPTYTFINGKFVLEDKDLVKKRLGRSPDLGDALALTFAIPDQPASDSAQGMFAAIKGGHRSEYDPFETDNPMARHLTDYTPGEI